LQRNSCGSQDRKSLIAKRRNQEDFRRYVFTLIHLVRGVGVRLEAGWGVVEKSATSLTKSRLPERVCLVSALYPVRRAHEVAVSRATKHVPEAFTKRSTRET